MASRMVHSSDLPSGKALSYKCIDVLMILNRILADKKAMPPLLVPFQSAHARILGSVEKLLRVGRWNNRIVRTMEQQDSCCDVMHVVEAI